MDERLYVDGTWRESVSGQRLEVRNPARPSEVVGTLAAGTDPDRALAVAGRIEADTTFVNQHSPFAVEISAPVGGFKQSGLGRELGLAGLEAFVELRQINSRSTA